jgi:hypothetical protein
MLYDASGGVSVASLKALYNCGSVLPKGAVLVEAILEICKCD